MLTSSDFFISVGPWKNWEYSLSKKPLLWGVRDDKQNSNLNVFNKLRVGSIVFFYANQDLPTKFSKRGLFGIGKVTRTYDENNVLYWPDELELGKTVYTHRFEMELIKIVENDSDLLSWIEGLPFTKGLNHIAKEIHLEKLLRNVHEKWNIAIRQEYIFPFIVNGFYERSEIRRMLQISPYKGIEVKRYHKIIAVFSNEITKKRVNDRGHNIYHDEFDSTARILYYTGQGQKGDQTLTGQNLTLARAKKEGFKVHLFRRYKERRSFEYLGEVEVIQRKNSIQRDAKGKKRKVIIFVLKLISDSSIGDSEAEEREIEFEQEQIRESGKSREELLKNLQEEDKKIRELGPKTKFVNKTRPKNMAERYRKIVAILKSIYHECQVCGTKHFEKNKGWYSEVHHIIPWSQTHEDSVKNLVVVCPTCHKKFDHAKSEIKQLMYKSLKEKFPNNTYNKPDYAD